MLKQEGNKNTYKESVIEYLLDSGEGVKIVEDMMERYFKIAISTWQYELNAEHLAIEIKKIYDVRHKSTIPIHRWETHTYKWGSAIKEQRTKRWYTIILNNGQELDVSDLDVVIHRNGIEFL